MGSIRIIPSVFSTCCFVFVNAGSDQEFLPRLQGGVIQLTEPFVEPGEPFTWVLETDVGLTIAGQPTVVLDDVNIINPTITFDPEYTKDSITLRLQADNCESSFDRITINTVLNSIHDLTSKNVVNVNQEITVEYYVGENHNSAVSYDLKNGTSFAAIFTGFHTDSNTQYAYREWTGTGWDSWITITVPVVVVSSIPRNIQVRAVNLLKPDYISNTTWRFWKELNRNLLLNASYSMLSPVTSTKVEYNDYTSPDIFFIRISEEDVEGFSNVTRLNPSSKEFISYTSPPIFFSRVTEEDLESSTLSTRLVGGVKLDYSDYTNPQFFYSGQSGV